MIDQAVKDRETLQEILRILRDASNIWCADTLDEIAGYLNSRGYRLDDDVVTNVASDLPQDPL